MDYSYIIIPVIVLITSQALKLATDSIRGNFDIKNIFISYGGMPSSHTALSVSIATLVGLRLGFDSATFGVALIFAMLVVRDATTFRRLLGQQAKTFNYFIDKLAKDEKEKIPRFRERMGHSLLEVSAGGVWGIVLTYFLNLL
jgi:acid phosphatase family membrane protein YuiD